MLLIIYRDSCLSYTDRDESESETEVAQSCPTLSDPMDCSLPGSSVHGIFQARVLEWGAIAFSETLLLHSCKIVQSIQNKSKVQAQNHTERTLSNVFCLFQSFRQFF